MTYSIVARDPDKRRARRRRAVAGVQHRRRRPVGASGRWRDRDPVLHRPALRLARTRAARRRARRRRPHSTSCARTTSWPASPGRHAGGRWAHRAVDRRATASQRRAARMARTGRAGEHGRIAARLGSDGRRVRRRDRFARGAADERARSGGGRRRRLARARRRRDARRSGRGRAVGPRRRPARRGGRRLAAELRGSCERARLPRGKPRDGRTGRVGERYGLPAVHVQQLAIQDASKPATSATRSCSMRR